MLRYCHEVDAVADHVNVSPVPLYRSRVMYPAVVEALTPSMDNPSNTVEVVVAIERNVASPAAHAGISDIAV